MMVLTDNQTRPGEPIGKQIGSTKQLGQIKLFKVIRYRIKGQHIKIVRILLDKGVFSRARKKDLEGYDYLHAWRGDRKQVCEVRSQERNVNSVHVWSI